MSKSETGSEPHTPDTIGADGLTDRQRAIDPDPAHWRHPGGAPVDDSKDTEIP